MKPKNRRHWAEARVNPPLLCLTLAREGAREQNKPPTNQIQIIKKSSKTITTSDVVHTNQKPKQKQKGANKNTAQLPRLITCR